MVIVLCIDDEPIGIVGTAVLATTLCAAAAATAAAFAVTVGGNIGLQGECELPDALDDANGTPVDEYKSWLNYKQKNLRRKKIQLIKKFNDIIFYKKKEIKKKTNK